MINAIIYDLDGTVLNTLTTIAAYANETMTHCGLAPFAVEDYKHFVGNGAKVLIERMLTAANVPLDRYFDKAFRRYNALYDNAPIGLTAPYDGIPALVATANAMGIKQAILSNKPDTAVKGVMAHFLQGEFQQIYGGRDGIPLKPDPTALLALLQELGVNKDECLYVGDTAVDIQTGKNAGVTTVGVLWGFRDRQELEDNHADYIVSHPSEILDIIHHHPS